MRRAVGAAATLGRMTKNASGHLEDPSGDWWYNNKTGKVEQGRLSPGVDRDGPFRTREEAERAPELFRERSKEWIAEEDAEYDAQLGDADGDPASPDEV